MTDKRRAYYFGVNQRPFGGLGALFIFAIVMIGIYYLIKGAYYILGIIAPILLIATLIIDHKVVTNYLKFLLNSLKLRPLMGLIYIFLTIVGAPFLAGFLFFKAWMTRLLNKYVDEQTTEQVYTDYEEVLEEEDFFILPEIEEPRQAERKNNNYEDLFD